MNIAFFSSAFYPSLGGVEEVCRQLAHAYRKLGWRITVITNRWPRDQPSHEVFEGIPIFRFPLRTPDVGYKSRLSYTLTHRLVRERIIALLRRRNIDVVHIHCVSNNAHYGRLSAVRLNLPLVVSLHGELSMDATRLFERSAFARGVLRATLRSADYIIGCADHTLREAEHFIGHPFAAPSRVVHNGVSRSEFISAIPRRHPYPYLLAMGRHVLQKGFDVLLRAFAALQQRNVWKGDLIVAGDGPERRQLETLAVELGIRDRVVFTGRADRKTVVSLYAGCELFVLPSRHEPFGIVNLEAMVSGKPVVATDVGGVSEIVQHGRTGWLVAPDNPEALADGIAHVLRNPTLRATLVQHGLAMADAHEWDAIAKQYAEIYEAVTTTPATRVASSTARLTSIAENI